MILKIILNIVFFLSVDNRDNELQERINRVYADTSSVLGIQRDGINNAIMHNNKSVADESRN